jgi:hypothetical protein
MLPAWFASLVLLMAAEKKKPLKTGTSSGHITNLKQSILETLDIYGTKHIRIMEIANIRNSCLTQQQKLSADLS